MIGFRGLSTRDGRALAIGTVIVVAALAIRGVPAWRAWVAAAQAASELAVHQLTEARTAIDALPAVRDSLAVARARYAALGPAFLLATNPGTAAADLGALVGGTATTAGLAVGNISVRSDTSSGSVFARPSARGTARGDIAGLTQFLFLLELGPPLLLVRHLTVTQAEPGATADRPEDLRIEFVIEGLAPARQTRNAQTALTLASRGGAP